MILIDLTPVFCDFVASSAFCPLPCAGSGPPTNDPDGVLPKGPGGNAAWGVTDSLLAWAATGLISFTQV